MDKKELIWGSVCLIRSEKVKHVLIVIVNVTAWRSSYQNSWDIQPWAFNVFRGQAEISKIALDLFLNVTHRHNIFWLSKC